MSPGSKFEKTVCVFGNMLITFL